MKRLFSLLILFSIVLPAFAIEAPSWSEFCPADRLSAEYRNMERYPETFNNNLTHPVLYKVCKYSIVGTPIAFAIYVAEYQEQVRANYWAKRKQDFDKEIESCNQMMNKDNKIVCYMDVRRLENDKTNQHETQMIEEQELRLQRLQLYQQQQINNNLRNLNYKYYKHRS